MTAHLVTLAHSTPLIREQAEFSALSVQAWGAGADFCHHVFTDDPAAFARLGSRVDVRAVDRARLENWLGAIGYVHRAKPAVLQELANEFPGEPVLFLDADTFATAPIDRLLERVGRDGVVLYEREYNVAQRNSPMMFRFRRKLARARFRGAPIRLDVDMWNSGVVGLAPARTSLLEPWLAFLDEVYPVTQRWVLEQFALSVLLADGRIAASPCADLFAHYWWDKPAHLEAARNLLRGAESVDEILERIRSRPIVIPRPPARVREANLLQRLFGW
ncbi:MAG: hypothetical protein QM765_10625 [Myxococcales bacterium]